MDIISLLKILTKWGLESENYDLVLFIYSNFKIGIPVNLLYKLKDSNRFNSVSSFLKDNSLNKDLTNEYLRRLFELFLKSKYVRLQYWNHKYGYFIKN
jgi:hypothetical protein